jgi:hypothetical protein
MVQRWVPSTWLLTEKHFRRLDGHATLWSMAAILGRPTKSTTQPSKESVAQNDSSRCYLPSTTWSGHRPGKIVPFILQAGNHTRPIEQGPRDRTVLGISKIEFRLDVLIF